MNPPREQNLEAKLNLIKFPTNTALTYELDENVPWVQALLIEMNETATDKKPTEWLLETSLKISIQLVKKFKNEYGEYLLATGHFACDFVTESVRSLKTVKESMDVEFKAVFFQESILKGEEFTDLDEMWVDGDTYEIYPYEKATADIAEMLHEQLFLNRNPYPVAEDEMEADASFESDKPRQ